MKTCLIISGGDFYDPPEHYPSADLVIACDRGYEYARKLGIRPDLIIGDFDSAEKPITDIPMLVYPSQKDDTDTMLAIKEALKQGAEEIILGCCMGGRMDHTFANIQSAVYIAHENARAVIMSEGTVMTFIKNTSAVFPKRKRWSLSVFAITDSCLVTLRGTSYEVTDVEVNNHFPLGVSNNWNADEAEITVKNGILMVMECRLHEAEHIDEGDAWANLAEIQKREKAGHQE